MPKTPALSKQDLLQKVLDFVGPAQVAAVQGAAVLIVFIRGYYRDTMGKVGANDRGIWDDAAFLVSSDYYAAYQANTDPSVYRKGIATLQPGVYTAVKHRHKGQYPAFQIVRDVLKRDGSGDKLDVGRHGINIHHGGNGTWSEGCLTFPPVTWAFFQRKAYALMDAAGAKDATVVLLEN